MATDIKDKRMIELDKLILNAEKLCKDNPDSFAYEITLESFRRHKHDITHINCHKCKKEVLLTDTWETLTGDMKSVKLCDKCAKEYFELNNL